MGSRCESLTEEIRRVSHHLAERRFPEVASALHAAIPETIRVWRTRSLEAMPHLTTLTVAEFENSIAASLHLLANALERDDPSRLQTLIDESPAHGLLRFLQHFGPETLLAEERILRSVVVIQLRRELGRAPTADESAALHELLDLMGEKSLLALMGKRGEEHDRDMLDRVSGMRRLADLGTLVAGVAHDAANLLLPLRMRLEHLGSTDLAPGARDDLTSIELIVDQFQNSIVNLRWLSIDSGQGPSSSKHPRPRVSIQIQEWADGVVDFHRRMLPPSVRLDVEIAPQLPPVAISSAALSQAVFNLIHNAAQAITSVGERATGRIVLRAEACGEDAIHLAVEDDGPGMSEEVLRRSTEPFFTTRASGSGLGLSLVRALLEGCGGSIGFVSPPPGKGRGTVAVMKLLIAKSP